MLRICRFALACVAFLAVTEVRAQDALANDPRAQGLSPGDQVRIAVWRSAEFSGDFMVSANGTLSHPLYREIQVTGVSLETVEERLRTFLTRYIANPQFVLQPLVKIIVGGEVRTPNIYSVPPETTIAQAIVLAGGPTAEGRLDRVRVVRDGQATTVDLVQANSEVATLRIRSGDQILVTRRRNIFRDVVVPSFSAVAAVAAVLNIFIR
ncbi:MAG: polysaccharide biosynthesis/export family protein [Gemmatimonadaceae bacterium]|nr:polysaccharide biosynthesis/export family protein [Gemmatimonadaceae bacterium]